MGDKFYQIKSYVKHYFMATRKGHNVHSPFAYKLCEEVFYNTSVFYDFEILKSIRSSLLKDESELIIEDFGAGSRNFSGNKRKVNEIAAKGISPVKQGELLYKLINYLNAQTIIELGTSVGITSLYLSLANKQAKVYSIEGSNELSLFAKELAKNNRVLNCTFINAKFDLALPQLLNELDSVDVLYVDGNHAYEATLNYFKIAKEKCSNDSVFIFDDIYWNKNMTKAWKEIKQDSTVTLSIDAFYFGMIFFKKEFKEKVHLKILL